MKLKRSCRRQKSAELHGQSSPSTRRAQLTHQVDASLDTVGRATQSSHSCLPVCAVALGSLSKGPTPRKSKILSLLLRQIARTAIQRRHQAAHRNCSESRGDRCVTLAAQTGASGHKLAVPNPAWQFRQGLCHFASSWHVSCSVRKQLRTIPAPQSWVSDEGQKRRQRQEGCKGKYCKSTTKATSTARTNDYGKGSEKGKERGKKAREKGQGKDEKAAPNSSSRLLQIMWQVCEFSGAGCSNHTCSREDSSVYSRIQ